MPSHLKFISQSRNSNNKWSADWPIHRMKIRIEYSTRPSECRILIVRLPSVAGGICEVVFCSFLVRRKGRHATRKAPLEHKLATPKGGSPLFHHLFP
jgi:hypothetical protein